MRTLRGSRWTCRPPRSGTNVYRFGYRRYYLTDWSGRIIGELSAHPHQRRQKSPPSSQRSLRLGGFSLTFPCVRFYPGENSVSDSIPVIAEDATSVGYTEKEPTYRVRIAHTHTLKDGWRLSETTVEASGSEIDFQRLKDHMALLFSLGTFEAEQRNKMDRRLRGETNAASYS